MTIPDDITIPDLKYSCKHHPMELGRKGQVIVVQNAEAFWADEPDKAKDYRSDVLVNPSYLDLFGCAYDQMHATTDYTHCYFEGFRVIRRKRGWEAGIIYIELILGS